MKGRPSILDEPALRAFILKKEEVAESEEVRQAQKAELLPGSCYRQRYGDPRSESELYTKEGEPLIPDEGIVYRRCIRCNLE